MISELSFLQRKSRGRIWNRDPLPSEKNKKKKSKKTKKHEHFRKHWDEDLWD